MSIRKVPFADHDEWLAIRKNYIGGSNAGAVMGMNPYASAFSVWAEKTGSVPPFAGNLKTKIGSQFEEFVASMFEEETGKKVRRCNFTLVNDDYPWACANLDREVVGEDAILECKFTNSHVNTMKFKDGEYPTQWLCQMMHYLAVTGKQKAYLAVLSECRDFHVFELERDEEDIRTLMEAEERFWNDYVITGVQPPVDDSESTASTLAAMYPEDDGSEIVLDVEEALLARRKVLKDSEKTIRDELAGIDNEIKAKIGNASTAVCGAYKISFKEQATSGIDRKRIAEDFPTLDFKNYATRTRVLRVSSPKEKSA